MDRRIILKLYSLVRNKSSIFPIPVKFILFLTRLYNKAVATIEQLKGLGAILREARKAKKLTLEDVEELSGVSKNYIWLLEEAYVQGKRQPTVPSDEKLVALARALGLPIRELHAALGRVPAGSPAAQLVREKLAEYKTETHPDASELEDLSSEVDHYAQVRVEHRMSRLHGRELQKQ